MSARRIAVLGAGNGGFAAAADLSHGGNQVTLHARNPERLRALLQRGGVETRGVVQGFVTLSGATPDLKKAIEHAELIMLVVPSIAHEFYAHELAPLLDGQPIVLNPGHTLGAMHFAKALRDAGYRDQIRICEIASLPYVARMQDASTVNIYSRISGLGFSAYPSKCNDELFRLVGPLFPDLRVAANIIETGLSNINAVFHPPGMILNAGWIEHTGGDFLFYREGITNAVGLVTAQVDFERLQVAKAFGVEVRSLLEMLFASGLTTKEARDGHDISRACKESKPNATIKSPHSLSHRYVQEDIGMGLLPIASLGKLAGVATPTMSSLVHLAGLCLGIDYERDGLTLERIGIRDYSVERILRLVTDEGAAGDTV